MENEMRARIQAQSFATLQAYDEYVRQNNLLIRMQDELARFCCPYFAGQVVEVASNTHNGKKMRITCVRRPEHDFMGDWMVRGIVLKKDGSDSKYDAAFAQIHMEPLK